MAVHKFQQKIIIEKFITGAAYKAGQSAVNFCDFNFVTKSQDCLRLMCLILEDNTNTQTFFREMGFMHKLLPLFENSSEWDNRRAMIASTALDLVSARVFICFRSMFFVF